MALDADTNTHELGRIGQADAPGILTAEVAAEQARVEFQNAQRMFLAHYARLETLAGQHSLDVHPLKGALVEPPAFNPEDYVQRDVEESPLVKQAQSNVTLNEAKLKDAKRERVPNLNVTAGEWYSGEEVQSGAKAGWESFAQAGVQLPLWNHNQGNIQAAKVLVNRANEDVERTKLWTRHQTEPLAQQYLSAQFTAERYRTQMIPRARRAYQLEVTKYQQMSQEYPSRACGTAPCSSPATWIHRSAESGVASSYCSPELRPDGRAGLSHQPGVDSTTINLPTAPGGNQ